MRRWRADEDALLLELYGNGVGRRQIAETLARTVDAVDARRRALRCVARAGALRWRRREDEFLRAARAARIPAFEIASRLGRSVEAVRSRGRKVGPAGTASRRYTPSEDATLEQHWNNGGNIQELALALARSPEALRLRARQLGIADPPRRKRRTPEEDELLRDGYARGLTCRSIAVALLPGRTPGAVAARAGLLGLALHGRRWTARETRELAELTRCGYSIEETAVRLERSVEAVRQRCAKLAIATPRSAVHRNGGKPWSATEDAVLCQDEDADFGQLSRRLSRSEQSIRRRRAQLGVGQENRRSPHRTPPRASQASAAERRMAEHALNSGSARFLAVARRLGRPPGELRREAQMEWPAVRGSER